MSGILAQLSSVATKVLDPLWEYVTLLLHGDGTNGAQNNTFIDSSTNNFTITRNGNTTQGTFSPYGNNWSNYFGGVSTYRLNAPANAAFAFGTGAFTVEAWIFVYNLSAENFVFDTRSSASTAGVGFSIEATTGKLRYSGSANNVLTTTAITANTWNHVAWVYNGTTLTGYINGVSGGTATPSFNITQNNGQIGNVPFSAVSTSAYISNVRVVKGTAVYTAAFIPSTKPLTAISGTSLLTCQNNRFVDNSTNAFAITVSGSPTIQRFSPFNPYSQYRDKTIGGSGYFDGTGDYLSTPALATIGAGEFSQEAWVYTQSSTGTPLFWDAGTGAGTFLLLSGTTSILGGINGNVVSTGTYTIPLNAWTHLVYCRSGTTLSIFANGARIATGTVSTSATAGSYAIGIAKDLTRPFTGFMSGIRFVHGASAYNATSTTITVPTAPVTAITSTTLLLSTTNAGIYDNAMMNNLETVGNAQVSTTKSKFGGTSLYFDGTGDYLTIPAQQNYNFGTGSFTIEFWINYTSVTTYAGLFDARAAGGTTANWAIGLYTVSATNRIDFIYGTTRLTTTSAITANTWTHVAIVRSSGVIKVYINGTADATTATSSVAIDAGSAALWIGAAKDPYYLNGYLDDVRITKGSARYTANFSVPTQSFTNQ